MADGGDRFHQRHPDRPFPPRLLPLGGAQDVGGVKQQPQEERRQDDHYHDPGRDRGSLFGLSLRGWRFVDCHQNWK